MEIMNQPQIILRVFLDATEQHFSEVPLTPASTSADVIECCREAGEAQCHLAELWRGCERPLADEERPFEILQQWGAHRDEVKFFLRHHASNIPADAPHGSRRKNGFRREEDSQPLSSDKVGVDGVGDLTLAELQEMAARQQHQIQSQQHVLVAKEQRLKFLQQQERRHQQLAGENERVRRLRERVAMQEAKLGKLRAMKGRVSDEQGAHASLTSELDAIKSLFSQKEEELNVAVSRVEGLTKQLEELRKGSTVAKDNRNSADPASQTSSSDLDKLRQELQIRNQVNNEQNDQLIVQRDALSGRQAEMAIMDQRIAQLQLRLRNRKLQQQQQQQLQKSNIAAVEPIVKSAFSTAKQDPKYQTLPHSIKLPGSEQHFNTAQNNNNNISEDDMAYKGVLTTPIVGGSQVSPNRGSSSHIISNFAPRPYGASYKKDNAAPAATSSAASGQLQQPPASVQSGPPFPKTSTPVSCHVSAHSANVAREREVFITGGPSPPHAVPFSPVYSSPTRPSAPPSYSAATHRLPTQSSQVAPSDSNGYTETSTSFAACSDPSSPPSPPAAVSDTSPPAVSSALTVLMQSSASSTSPTTTSPGKTYRYAPKSVIANTYMRKLGSNALEQYRKNMSALYSSSENQPTAPVQPITAQDETSASSPYNIDPERARLAYATRPNAPRPLRRRLSSGEVPQAGDFQRVSNMTQAPGLAPARSPSLEDEAFVRHEPNNNHKEDESAKEPCHMPRSTSLLQKKKGNLKKQTSLHRNPRNVTFDPLALLLDASLEGELDLVKRSAEQVPDPSTPNDEGITALHNAICAGHYEIVKFLIEFGCDVNAPDSDGWTPLHCAASCNNLPMVKFLVEHGACIFAQTISDQETAAEKCEEDEDGFDGCSQYLYGIQEKLGSMNKGCVFAVFDYEAEHSDELSVKNQDKVTIVRRGDDQEVDWWWAKRPDRSEGYLPKNLLGLCPRVIPKWLTKK